MSRSGPDADGPARAARRLCDLAQGGGLDEPLARLDIRLLTLFGSAADPAPLKAPSDIDIAVLHGPAGELLATITALIELVGSDAVDVMDLGRAGPVARAEALGPRCIPLFEARGGLYAEQQMAALTERMETAYLRRLDLRLLAG